MKKLFIQLISYLFYDEGTHLGKRCSGHRVYPGGAKCYGCSDCEKENKNFGVRF